MRPIRITEFDVMAQPKGAKYEEDGDIRSIVGVHTRCGLQILLIYYSNRWSELVCRCGWRCKVPAEVRTYRELRAYFADKNRPSKRRKR